MLAGIPSTHEMDRKAFLSSGYSSFLHRKKFSAVAVPTILLVCIPSYKTLYLFSMAPIPAEESNICLNIQ